MGAGCRYVDQHAKRAVKAEARFFRHTPIPRASYAVCREPDGANSSHTEEKIYFRFCIGFARWRDRNPRGVSEHVGARTGIEKKLYRHPERQRRRTARR
jgi:hypothetical protein